MSALKLLESEQTSAVSASGILMATVRARVWSTLLPRLHDLTAQLGPFCLTRNQQKKREGKEWERRERKEREEKKEKKKRKNKTEKWLLSITF